MNRISWLIALAAALAGCSKPRSRYVGAICLGKNFVAPLLSGSAGDKEEFSERMIREYRDNDEEAYQMFKGRLRTVVRDSEFDGRGVCAL